MAANKRISEKRRRRRSLREAALACLEMELPEDDALRPELVRRGLEPSGSQAVLFQQWRKAAGGDTAAAKFLRDTAGEEEEKAPQAQGLQEELEAMTDQQLRAIAGKRWQQGGEEE